MGNLEIGFLESSDEHKNSISVNGISYSGQSYSYDKIWLYIRDEDLFNALENHEVKELLKYFKHIHITIEVVDNVWLEVSIYSRDSYTRNIDWVSAALLYKFEDWNRPWTIKQHFNSFLKKIGTIPNAELECDVDIVDEHTGEPIYNLMNGIGVGIPIEDSSISLKSIYDEISGLCLSRMREVENEFLSFSDKGMVERIIEFPPEYHQAGLGILNYFGTYLREQYPNENASVRIEQVGLEVRLVVETEDGKSETIEKALNEYELIITGAEQPQTLSHSDKLIFELKNELRIAQFRLESQKDLIGMQNGRIDQLLNIVGNSLSQKNQVVIDFKPDITLSNKVEVNQDIKAAISHLNKLKKELPRSNEVYSVLNELEGSLVSIETNNDPASVRRSSAMCDFKRLIDKVVDNGSDLNSAIDKIESGWKVFSELAGKYNSVAEWCGLPVIPRPLLKKS